MKRFTSVSLLLAGLIATCTFARNIEVDNNWDRGSSSSEESSEPTESQFETVCSVEETSSNETSLYVLSYPICYSMRLDVSKFKVELLDLNASTRRFFFPKYCLQMRNDIACTEPLMKQFGKCVGGDILTVRHNNATLEVLDLVCKNDGEILFRDEEMNYKDCVQFMQSDMKECFDVVSESTYDIAVSKFGEIQCGECAKVRACMLKGFNKCKGPSLIELVNVYFRALFKDSPCRNLIADTFDVEDDRRRNETV